MTRADSSQRRVLHCDCGEIREVSVALPVLACVRCGARMHDPRPPEPPIPSKLIVTGASVLIELLCAIGFTLAALWMLRTGDTGPRAIAIAAICAVGILTGAMAYRGSVGGLIVGGAIAAAIAFACAIDTSAVAELFVRARVAPLLVRDPQKLATITAGVALIALGVCIAALPQARRFAAWQRMRIERAFALTS